MEDIKVGELVRTKKGKIEKIKTVNRYEIVTKHNNDNDDISEGINYYAESGLEINKMDITKHSFNLIDLIENNDIVLIKGKGTQFVNLGIVRKREDQRSGKLNILVNGQNTNEFEILEVLTHEQYEANCYKAR